MNKERERIINENYMELIDVINMSDRNKDIIRKVINGNNNKEVGEEYNISANAVRNILVNYTNKCYRTLAIEDNLVRVGLVAYYQLDKTIARSVIVNKLLLKRQLNSSPSLKLWDYFMEEYLKIDKDFKFKII